MMSTDPSASASLDAKRQRLAELLRREAAKPKYQPVSVEQRRFWILYQLDPKGAGYNMPFFVRLTGALRIDALQAAFTEIVRRHEVLRTAFPMRGGQPVQEIHPPAPFGIPIVDLSRLSDAQRDVAAGKLRQEEADRPFDLLQRPPLRVTLIRLSEFEHELLVSNHHIVSDGWSEGILSAELQSLYNGLVELKPTNLPECPIQYADYAVWQQNSLAS